MKTTKEWFELMPIEIREKALSYTDEDSLIRLRDNFQDALGCAFIYKHTEEGHAYWWEISLKY